MTTRNVPAIILSVMLLCAGLTACTQNEWKIETVQTQYASLVGQFTDCIPIYNSVQATLDPVLATQYSDILKYIDEFGNIKLTGKNNDELDAILDEIEIKITAVFDLKTSLQLAAGIDPGIDEDAEADPSSGMDLADDAQTLPGDGLTANEGIS